MSKVSNICLDSNVARITIDPSIQLSPLHDTLGSTEDQKDALPDTKELKVDPKRKWNEDASIFFVGTATTVLNFLHVGGTVVYTPKICLEGDQLQDIPARYPNVDVLLIHLVCQEGLQFLGGIELVLRPDITIPIHYDDYGRKWQLQVWVTNSLHWTKEISTHSNFVMCQGELMASDNQFECMNSVYNVVFNCTQYLDVND
ncbi:hypothetical protein BU17DRAFT_71370 [Hysterangium stoloniferum]|nr:hypothetical protein BU17DRAFT_71370 [Hysterangium stoloniferum]